MKIHYLFSPFPQTEPFHRLEPQRSTADTTGLATGSPESKQPTGSQIIKICLGIYSKIDKTVKDSQI